jgi:mRNA interferase MazF
MGILVEKGEVVVLPFTFSDLSNEKLRPALVLAVPRRDELISCQITKQKTRPEYTVLLTSKDFLNGKLEVDPCYIRPNHIFTADPKIVYHSVGKLKPEKMQEVLEIVFTILFEDDKKSPT